MRIWRFVRDPAFLLPALLTVTTFPTQRRFASDFSVLGVWSRPIEKDGER